MMVMDLIEILRALLTSPVGARPPQQCIELAICNPTADTDTLVTQLPSYHVVVLVTWA